MLNFFKSNNLPKSNSSEGSPIENIQEEIKKLEGIITMLKSASYGCIDLNMNDTFGYGCADSEELFAKDWDRVSQIFLKFGHDGVNAWVAVQRGGEVINELNTRNYRIAKKEIIEGKI